MFPFSHSCSVLFLHLVNPSLNLYELLSKRKFWSQQGPAVPVTANNSWRETWTEAHLKALQKFRSRCTFRSRNTTAVSRVLPPSQWWADISHFWLQQALTFWLTYLKKSKNTVRNKSCCLKVYLPSLQILCLLFWNGEMAKATTKGWLLIFDPESLCPTEPYSSSQEVRYKRTPTAWLKVQVWGHTMHKESCGVPGSDVYLMSD